MIRFADCLGIGKIVPRHAALNTDSKLIFSFLRNPNLGLIVEGFLVKILDDKSYSYQYQRVNYDRRSDYEYAFTDDELKVLRITSELQWAQIERVFNAKKLKRELFLEKLAKDPERLQQVNVYFDKRIAQILDILRGQNVYWRDKISDHPGMIPLKVCQEPVRPVYRFERREGIIHYSLRLFDGDKEVALRTKGTQLITQEPGWFMQGAQLHALPPGTEGPKLMPFMEKEEVLIPEKHADAFISKFLIKASRKAEVLFEGFEVQDRAEQQQLRLKLSIDLEHKPVFWLQYLYDQFETDDTQSQEVLARMQVQGLERKIVRLHRDRAWEQEHRQALCDATGLREVKPGWYLPETWDLGEKSVEACIEWLSEHAARFIELNVATESQWQGKTYLTGLAEVITRELKQEDDWFDLQITVKIAGIELPFIRFRKHILEKNREFVLTDGRVFLLPEAWFVQFADLFEFGEESLEGIRLHRQHHGLLQGHPLLTGELNTRLSDEQKRVYLEPETRSFALPKGLQAKLRDYQKKGYDWLVSMVENRLGACLADDMGLGKTLQVIALLQHLKEEKTAFVAMPASGLAQLDLFGAAEPSDLPNLIVMSPSLLHNWEREIRRFAPELRVTRHAGSRRSAFAGPLMGYDVILTTYGVVRNDQDMLSQMAFRCVVLDESQLIKNMRSVSFQSVRKLQARHRIVLTGTPVENSLTDLWSQLTFLQPGLLGSFRFFRQEFVLPIEQNGDARKLEKLQRLIQPFILRRTKEEVAPELPAQTRIVNYSVMDGAQKERYEELKSYYRNLILDTVNREGIPRSQMLILRGLTQLRQLAIHPALEDPAYDGDSAKFRDVLARLEVLASEGRKVLVFSQFVKHLNLFRKHFEQEARPYSWLTGSVPQLLRKDIIDTFDRHPGHRVFLIQTKTGGAGLNLTKADSVFLLDPWWNPALEEQAIGRSHRIGQQQQVFVWRFITQETIEEKMMKLQERKSKLAQDLIGHSNPLTGISREEIEELFG